MSKIMKVLENEPVKDYINPREDADKLFQRLYDILGPERLLDEMADALSADTLLDICEWLARMHDINYDPEDVDDSKKTEDALTQPSRVENRLKGQGIIASARPAAIYKNFLIYKTKDGKFDVYDRKLTIYGTQYESVEEAKKDIDEFPAEKVGVYTGNKLKHRLSYGGFAFFEATDGTAEVKQGGEAATQGGEFYGEDFRSVSEALMYLLSEGLIKLPEKNGTNPGEAKAREYLENDPDFDEEEYKEEEIKVEEKEQ